MTMAYKSKHGITKIKKARINALDISRDYDTNPNREYPVLLYTPDMENTDEHHHIPLTLKESKALHQWLGEFLKAHKKKRSASKSKRTTRT